MAKPKAAAYIADRLASEAAGRPSEEHRNAAAQTEVENPWVDMDDVSDDFVQIDHFRHLAILPPPGTGVPCTSCHRQHAGPCTFEDLLIADMNIMQFYAEVFLPAGPWFHDLRVSLYKLLGEIHHEVNFEEPRVTADKFGVLRAAALNLKARCDLYVELGMQSFGPQPCR